MPLSRLFPDIAAVFGVVFLVLSAKITHTHAEIQIQTPTHRQRITVLDTAAVTQFRLIARTARFKVLGQHLAVKTEVVSGKRLFCDPVPEISAKVQLPTVNPPIAMPPVATPPRVHP